MWWEGVEPGSVISPYFTSLFKGQSEMIKALTKLALLYCIVTSKRKARHMEGKSVQVASLKSEMAKQGLLTPRLNLAIIV